MSTHRILAGSLLLSLTLQAFATQPGSYRFELIPTFDEPNPETLGLALAINDMGEVVGLAEDADLIARGFLYRDGVRTEVPGFDPGTQSSPRAINRFGEVAGDAGKMGVFQGIPVVVGQPFVFTPGGAMRNLLNEEEIAASAGGDVGALNDLGQAAMWARGNLHLVAPDGGRSQLSSPDLDIAGVGALDNEGRLAGSRWLNQGGQGAILLDAATLELTDLHAPEAARSSALVAFNREGVGLGHWARQSDNRTVPVLWRDGQAQPLPFINEDLPGWIGLAVALNDRGDVLGESVGGPGELVSWILFAGSEQPIALTTLLDEAFFDDFDNFVGFDLNNDREIAGAAVRIDQGAFLNTSNKPGIIRLAVADAKPFPAPGLWADPAQPGTGFELNRVGDVHYLTWYTFDDAGRPIWYFSDAVSLDRDGWRADWFEFSQNPDGEIVREAVGQAVLFHRQETELEFVWRLHDRAGSSRYRYLSGPCEAGAIGATASWFDPESPGFGASVQQVGSGLAAVFYFYDTEGDPRWVYLDLPDGPGTVDAWLFHDGPCPGCPFQTPLRATVGAAGLSPEGELLALAVDLAGVGDWATIQWQSDNLMSRLSSAPSCLD